MEVGYVKGERGGDTGAVSFRFVVPRGSLAGY
jgi:hypothetical protein